MVHFIAWRYLADKPAYVEHVGNGQHRGDRYSYTSDIKGAKGLTKKQARDFCKYMRECGTIGFWSGQIANSNSETHERAIEIVLRDEGWRVLPKHKKQIIEKLRT